MKWVGLFTIATIGFSTIKGLWDLLGDLNVSPVCLNFVKYLFNVEFDKSFFN